MSAVIQDGFARLIFLLSDDVESKVTVSGKIIIIGFDQPIDLGVDKLAQGAPGYIGAARRDPDGRAVRIALSRNVKVNSMAVGERLFVDLLPDSWTGLPPGLPRDVIEELARRAHDAKIRQERGAPRDSASKITRSAFASRSQPTFTRYIFELPEPIGVTAENGKDSLTLTFSAPLKFDLADAQAKLPGVIQKLDSVLDQDSSAVNFTFAGKADARTFREDNSYVVDISAVEAPSPRKDGKADGLAGLAADLLSRKKAPPEDIEAPRSISARNVPAPTESGPQGAAVHEPERTAPETAMPASAAAPAVAPAVAAPAPAPVAAAPAPVVAAPARVGDATAPDMRPPTSTPPADPADGPAGRPSVATPADAAGTVNVLMAVQGDNLALRFPFAAPTPAAVFRRADILWLVFDTDAALRLPGGPDDPSHAVKSASVTRQRGAAIVRVVLARPRLISVAAEGAAWVVTLGSQAVESTQPLTVARNGDSSRRSARIAMRDPGRALQLDDPDAGDSLLVVTALAPERGFLNVQTFVEFRILPSSQGVVVQPLADDLKADVTLDGVVLSRPQGLNLSLAAFNPSSVAPDESWSLIDAGEWASDRKDDFPARQSQLIFSAAKSSDTQRLVARVALARFYLAQGMPAEAKGVLDVALKDDPPTAVDPMPLVLHAIANVMLGRAQEALQDLANPIVGNRSDAPLWRALAYARLGRWAEAHQAFGDPEAQLAALPVELQQMAMKDVVRAAVEVGDIGGAVSGLREFEALGIPHALEPAMSVITGRLAEREGRVQAALRSYQSAADSWDRPSAALGELRGIELQQSLDNFKRPEAIADLETLTATWRGDDTEVEALKVLAHLYTLDGRYRDAFHVMRTALMAHPNSELTHGIQDEATQTFESLFLAGRGDALPAIDALALFYDFKELTPIGRRGDEMIRKLSDRLVAVDLLDQAAGLLQYQVDNRLQGAARAQVAARLAVIYLMNHRPDQALSTLRATQTENLNNALREQRLLIQGRALSETGRYDVALEVIANISGPEAIRLRADILWAAKRWDEAAEQIELLYGDRWKDFAPLNEVERSEILRAAAGYALGEDLLGLGRFRERYAGKMATGPDRQIFDVLTKPIGATGTDFRAVAHEIAAVDTLDDFLRDMRARFPDSGSQPPRTGPAPAPAPGAPQAPGAPTGATAAR